MELLLCQSLVVSNRLISSRENGLPVPLFLGLYQLNPLALHIRKLLRIQLVAVALFIFLKAIRSKVLAFGPPVFLEITLYSLPNFWEGVVGVITVTMLALYLGFHRKFGLTVVHIGATVLSGIYVITQEFKLHNLGGDNIYDPYDVVFSIIGLLIGLMVIRKVGSQSEVR